MDPALLFIIFVDFFLAFAAAAFSKRTGFRLVGWFLIPILSALLLTLFYAGPRAFFARVAESHRGALLILLAAVIWGLAASSAGALIGYLWRVFRILK